MKSIIAVRRIVMLLALLLAAPSAWAQGFRSIMGKGPETLLKRKLAAYVVIKNKRIKLVANAQGNVPPEIAQILMTKLRTDVQKDTGFIEDEKNPETILRFTVTAFDNEHRNGVRQSGNDSVPFTLVTANVEVSYQAIETKSNAPVDSENLTANFKQDYPPSGGSSSNFLGRLNPLGQKIPSGSANSTLPPTKSEVQSYLLQAIVTKMAQRATPIEESFIVLLPRGKFDQIAKIAQNQAWAKVLEAASTMAPLPKPDEDSYRHYLIGLANEALAYQQTTNESVSQYLFKARQGYEEAKMKNSKEDEYIRPWTRVDEALKQYDKIMRQEKEYKDFWPAKRPAQGRTRKPPEVWRRRRSPNPPNQVPKRSPGIIRR